MDFESFCERPGPALALDGYVTGPPRWAWDGPHGSFNHHEGVDRLGTRATCEQILFAARGGLWDALGGPTTRVRVHVNDCDADVALSVWLLRNRHRIGEEQVELLVNLEGSLDCTGGCVAGPNSFGDVLDRVAWVFDPYNQWRSTSGTFDAPTMTAVIDAVGDRVTAWADGRAGATSSASDFEVLDRRGPVCAVAEYGPLARLRMHAEGIDVFVSVRDQGGVRVVSVGKSSPFVPFDLEAAFVELNELEGVDLRSPDGRLDCWGGSDLIGGSPRRSGTQLPVSMILDVVASHRLGPSRTR